MVILANGTVPRNYNHSSISLESRQRTPQILYTGSNRQVRALLDSISYVPYFLAN